MKLIFFLLLLFIYTNSLACSCGTISSLSQQEIAAANDIFVGKVIRVEPNDNQSRKITFQIIEKLKTDSVTSISVFTGLGGADCGLNVKEGQEWYLFTYLDKAKAWAGLCGRSALLTEHSIPLNPYRKKYYRQAVIQYNKNRARAQNEINTIRKTRL